jgi:hypothetical protein
MRIKVFVTMFNRFTWALPLLRDFERAGCEVILIDNNSTYPPLLEWYKTCPYKVHRMDKNHLAWAFFTTELYQQYIEDRYFIISDSDMDISRVPTDFVDVLFKALESANAPVWKAALPYDIYDLPDNEYTKVAVGANSGQFEYPNEQGYFKCDTDLGIALYDRSRRGDNPTKELNWYASVRLPRPYMCRHLDWYLTEETLREEDRYYFEQAMYYSYGCLWNDKINKHPVKNTFNK